MKRLALLAGIASTPVLASYVVACTKPSESVAPLDAAIAADPVVASSSSAPGMAAPPIAAIVSASASASASATTPSKRQACEALQQKVSALLAGGRACTTTADCDTVMTGCGLEGQCGASIAKTRKPNVETTSHLFYAKGCLDVLPPQPCATCAIPPPPKCVNGQCN